MTANITQPKITNNQSTTETMYQLNKTLREQMLAAIITHSYFHHH